MSGHVFQMRIEEVLDRLMPPPGWVPTAEEKHAHQMRRFRRAFEWHGGMGCYMWQPSHDLVDPGDRTYDKTGPEIAHSEWRAGYAYWDPPQLRPPPSLVVARTPCMAEDLGRPDDINDRNGLSDRRGYLCRFRHEHRGRSPYGDELPPEVRDRISRWLGEERT